MAVGRLATISAVAGLGLAAAYGLVEWSRQLGRVGFPYQVLLDHQTAQLAAPVPETVFFGDSTLGNAIDAAVWQELSGQSTRNLALTGFYGYAGPYNMLRRLLRHGRPKNVIVMQTAELLTREPEHDGYLMTLPPDEAGGPLYWPTLWRRYMNADEVRAAAGWVLNPASRTAGASELLENGYVRQGPAIALSSNVRGLEPRKIVPGKTHYLALLVELCRSEGLNCLYAHGPLADPICGRSRDYFARASRMVRDTGIRLASEFPPCLTAEQTGDTYDHAHPAFKRELTRIYYAAISPLLRR